MSKTNQPKFKIYSKLGLRLTDHPKIFLKKLGSKKWQSLYSNSKQPRKDTEYGAMLSAKQRLNLFYGQIKDKQFHTLYNNAKAYEGNQTINFIKLLERRLDVVLFRAKIAPSFREIRQLIQHGHVKVNDKVVKISSLILNKNDFFSFKATSLNFVKSKSSRYFSQIVNDNNVQAINWSLKSYNACAPIEKTCGVGASLRVICFHTLIIDSLSYISSLRNGLTATRILPTNV